MPFQTCLTILICLILGISGCMKAVAPKPAPPPAEVVSPPQVEMIGPYDSEIPVEYLDRLRRIPVAADEAAPLTLLTVADHFAVRGEVDKALHFLERAADGFVLGKNRSGEATAWSRKVILLFHFNREKEALGLIREAGGKMEGAAADRFPRVSGGPSRPSAGGFPPRPFAAEPVAPG